MSWQTRVAGLNGKIYFYFLAAATGVLTAALTLAPMNWGWLFLIFIPWMMVCLNQTKNPFWLGFAFGFGYSLIAFYWIGHAFLLSAVAFLIPLSIVGLPAVVAFYWGVSFWAAKRFWSSPVEAVLSFTFFWSVCFWAQGFFWTGFPWNFPAQVWIESLALAQNFHWLGIYGANFVMIFICASLFILTEPARAQKMLLPVLSLVFLFSLWGYGALRLSNGVIEKSKQEIIILQPNILQEHKWNPLFAKKIISTYFQLSQLGVEKAKSKNAIMIWPEAALPVNIERSRQLRHAIGKILPNDWILFSGFVRFAAPKAFNALFVLNDKGDIRSVYDKNHLVPFGEFLPLQSFLESLGARQLTGGRGGYAAGTTRPLLPTRALPLICFEISFPEEMIKATQRPQWIVNITNDGWYKDSNGPYQHFQLARIRAIEFGLPVARAANTGISAVIDPYGRVTKKIPLIEQGIIQAFVPKSIAATLYTLWGEWLFVLMLAVNAALLFTRTRNKL